MKIKGAFPVRWAAQDGADATLYELIPSADKITRKHDGTLSPATINCKAYKKTGTDSPELVTSGAQRSYDYYEGTVKHTVNNYAGGDITPTPWWTKIVFYLKSSDGVVLTQREILVENESISPELNLLNDTNFANLDLDSSTNSEVFIGEGVDGSNALLCNPSSLEKDVVPYTEVWSQSVSQPNDKRLLPSTWYTLSFWAKTLGYSQIDIKQSSNLYGFATKSVYLTVGTHTLKIRGYVSMYALSANRELRVFVYNDAWTWSASVAIRQSSITEAEVTFNITTGGTYKIASYCYASSGDNAAEGQTVYIEWYRLKITNYRVDKLLSYCYPNVIDTDQVQVHDGNIADSRPSDGYNPVALTTSWKRFYMTFKTKPTIPITENIVSFHIPQNGNSIYLSQMKLERGVFPTAWTGSNIDTKGYSGAKPYFLKYSEMADKEITVYQGVGDEEWYTIVYDDVENTGWYTPKYTHTTKKKEGLTDAKWWKSSMNFVATSVFFAQMAYIENLGVRNVLLSKDNKIEGGMCCSDDSLNLGDIRFWLGSSSPSSGTIRGYSNGRFVAANGKAEFYPSGKVTLCGRNATFDEYGNTTIANLTATSGTFTGEVNATSGTFTGEVNATSGTFKNVKINGSMRCTFQQPIEGSFRVDANDNVSLISVANTNSWIHNYTLPWDAGQSGRRITLVNWKWGDKTSTGYATIIAPKSYGFFENGITKDRLKMSREVVELLGYGTDTEFYGWIVLRRENIMTEHEYGRYQRILFWGSVRYYGENDVRLSQAWYDVGNHGATLSRIKEGLYEISFPSGIFTDAGKLLVMVTGFGYSAGYTDKPCKATVVNKTNTSFQVMVSDDDTPNDGGFDFFVANLGDWL